MTTNHTTDSTTDSTINRSLNWSNWDNWSDWNTWRNRSEAATTASHGTTHAQPLQFSHPLHHGPNNHGHHGLRDQHGVTLSLAQVYRLDAAALAAIGPMLRAALGDLSHRQPTGHVLSAQHGEDPVYDGGRDTLHSDTGSGIHRFAEGDDRGAITSYRNTAQGNPVHANHIDHLVQAMAAMATPSTGQTHWTDSHRTQRFAPIGTTQGVPANDPICRISGAQSGSA